MPSAGHLAKRQILALSKLLNMGHLGVINFMNLKIINWFARLLVFIFVKMVFLKFWIGLILLEFPSIIYIERFLYEKGTLFIVLKVNES